MEWTSIIVALITAGSMVIVQLLISRKQQTVAEAQRKADMDAADMRLQHSIDLVKLEMKLQTEDVHRSIKDLEKKQDKHNSLIERMVAVEKSTSSAHHRLDDMNRK